MVSVSPSVITKVPALAIESIHGPWSTVDDHLEQAVPVCVWGGVAGNPVGLPFSLSAHLKPRDHRLVLGIPFGGIRSVNQTYICLLEPIFFSYFLGVHQVGRVVSCG